MPELSIIMPLYNTENYVAQAIQSLLCQTYKNFELIIVDDASTDQSLEIVKSFNDSRIKILTNEKNEGIVFSRNRGLQIAKGKFIAPFDSDDIAMADKFEKQISFLKTNSEYGMIGSWVKLIDENGDFLKKKWKLNAPAERIAGIMLFRNYFVQSSVVIRRESVPRKGYAIGNDIVEDYLMWVDVAEKYKVWNYPEYLVKYRIHPQSATGSDVIRLQQKDKIVFQIIYNKLGIIIDNQLAEFLLKIKGDKYIQSLQELKDIDNFLLLILKQNAKLGKFNQQELKKVVFNRWIKSCYKARRLNAGMLKILLTSPLSKLFISFKL
ncbi:MAG: glycosyltransferase [Bacteroidota bacterium]